jgi:uncharacterized protein (DUF1778 family)
MRQRINLSVINPEDLALLRQAAGSMPLARWILWAALTMARKVLTEA